MISIVMAGQFFYAVLLFIIEIYASIYIFF